MTGGQGMGVGKKIGCGGAVLLVLLMGSCVSILGGAGEDEAASITTVTATATVTEPVEPTHASAEPTPAAVTETVEVTQTVTQTVTQEVTVTETVTAQIQGFADIPPAPTSAPPPPPAEPAVPPGGFANCTEAWAAGAAPVYAGDPGYSSRLDRDGDGVGCEAPP